jgi:hypothetical protein
MDTLAVAAALAGRGHGVTAVAPASDLAYSQRAAARHGGGAGAGAGAGAIRWLTFEMPFSPGTRERGPQIFSNCCMNNACTATASFLSADCHGEWRVDTQRACR